MSRNLYAYGLLSIVHCSFSRLGRVVGWIPVRISGSGHEVFEKWGSVPLIFDMLSLHGSQSELLKLVRVGT